MRVGTTAALAEIEEETGPDPMYRSYQLSESRSAAIRACGQLSEPDHHAGDADHGHEGLGGFVVTRGDATEVFDLVDKAFDQMTLLVQVGIVRDGLGAGTVRGDHGDNVVRAQMRF